MASSSDGRVTALLFAYNNQENVARLVHLLRGRVDRIVIIDNSTPANHAKNMKLDRGSVSVYRILPLGYVEPLRMYGLSKVETEWVLNLDLDETPSDALLEDIYSIIKRGPDAFMIRRDDGRSSAYITRLFRTDRVLFRGFIHEAPIIDGKLGALLDREYFISHERTKADLEESAMRYVRVEVLNGPLSNNYLREKVGFPFTIMPRGDGAISPAAFYSLLALYGIAWYASTLASSIAQLNFGKLRDGKAVLVYRSRIYEYYRSLPQSTQRSYTRYALSMLRAAGLIRYLGLDQEDRVKYLTDRCNNWKDGIANLLRILEERHKEIG